jgi:hypothetical protein
MLPRERFAWIWTIALIVIGAAYFIAVAIQQQSQAQLSFLTRIATLAIALASLGVVAGGERLFARLGGGGHPYAAPDERERFMDARSSTYAYYVLMAGMIVVGFVMPFGHGGWDIVHGALLAVIAAEVVHHGSLALAYRRGWRA